MANPNFDQILATTINNHRSTLVDNIFSARPLFHFLKQAGNIKMENGGAKIVVPLIHALNQASGSYSDRDPLSTAVSTGLSAAEFNWKQYYSTITISGLEELKNNGEEQIVNLLEAKIMQSEETIAENLDIMFLAGVQADGLTGNSNKDFNGLRNLIASHANNVNVGGINPTTNAYWASHRVALGGPLTIAALTTAFNTVTVGADHPGVMITTQVLYEKYESLLQPQARYTNMETADAGFQNLVFKNVPVTYDINTDAGYWYFVNPKYLQLIGHSDVWFKTTPFIRPEDVDAKFAQILLAGELVVSNRKRQGVITGATA